MTLALDVGSASRALEDVSGDRLVCAAFPGHELVALIDGLGHGAEAAVASSAAADVLMDAPGSPLELLLEHCHEALSRTRGVVMTVCRFDLAGRSLSWAGVGNVEARLLRRGVESQSPVLFGGVVGYTLPAIRPSTVSLEPGDCVLLATDGVRPDFAVDLPLSGRPDEVAERILERSARGRDDALAVCARVLDPA